MAIALDHVMVPCHHRVASARLLAGLLDVPWAEGGIGEFSPVYVNDGLTLDFDEADGAYPVGHYAFRVDDRDFDAILARLRAAGIAFRGQPVGADDGQVNTRHGGRIVYWSEPAGHVWEILTVSYARQPR